MEDDPPIRAEDDPPTSVEYDASTPSIAKWTPSASAVFVFLFLVLLPDAGLANVRLHAGPQYSLEVEQHGGRTDKHGQFVLAVDQSQNNPNDLFEQAQSAEEAADFAEAERLYRILMKSDPTDASAPLHSPGIGRYQTMVSRGSEIAASNSPRFVNLQSL